MPCLARLLVDGSPVLAISLHRVVDSSVPKMVPRRDYSGLELLKIRDLELFSQLKDLRQDKKPSLKRVTHLPMWWPKPCGTQVVMP